MTRCDDSQCSRSHRHCHRLAHTTCGTGADPVAPVSGTRAKVRWVSAESVREDVVKVVVVPRRLRYRRPRPMTHRRLPLLVLVVAVLVAGTSSPVHADDVTRRDKMLHLLNQTRRSHGPPCFPLNTNLSHFAWQHSKRMEERNECFHTLRSLRCGSLLQPIDLGRERRACGHVRASRTLWMGSAGHRANILNPAFRRVGSAS